MMEVAQHLEEARRWANRAEENWTKADLYRDDLCRRTMQYLARQSELWAQRAAEQAVKAALGSEDVGMQSRSGLHPYHDMLLFILREGTHDSRASRQRRSAIRSGDINNIRQWSLVRALAHGFNKHDSDVARDLVKTFRTLEDGQLMP